MTDVAFDRHSAFYDDIYATKDYVGECGFVENVIGRHSLGNTRRLLDLGCGTGSHTLILAERGFDVCGVDRSEKMIEIARSKEAAVPFDAAFFCGDVRDVRLDREFDAVISMFAVIGYLTEDDDVARMFETVRCHLRPGGLFVFDAWHGPSVDIHPPNPTERRVDIRGGGTATRRTRPTWHPERHMVSVEITIEHTDADGKVVSDTEIHQVRYFDAEGVKAFLLAAGFEFLDAVPFADLDQSLAPETPSFCVIARAV